MFPPQNDMPSSRSIRSQVYGKLNLLFVSGIVKLD
jgi:hypothetical protein